MGHTVQFVLHEYLQPLLQPCPSSLSLKNKDAVHPSPLKSLAAFTQKPCRTPLYKRSQTHQTSSAIAFSFLMFFSVFFFHVPAFWRACNNICSKKKERGNDWECRVNWLIGIRQRGLIIVGWGQTHPPALTHRTPSNVWAGDWRCAHHTVCLGLNAVE